MDYFSNKYNTTDPDLSFFLSTINYPRLPFGQPNGGQELSTVLIGSSYGGMLAIQMASRHPERFKALVLAGSSAKFADEKDGTHPVIIKKLKKDLERNFEETMKSCYKTFFSKTELQLAEQFVNDQIPPDKKTAIDMLCELEGLDLREVLRDIAIPTLIIHGDKDEVCPVGAAEFLHRNIKGSRLNILKGAGHMPFYTRAGEFNKILEEFLISVK